MGDCSETEMVELGAASEDDVVLAFLRAEIDSPKWGPGYSHALRDLKLNRNSLIDAADLKDAGACRARKDLLGAVRGYGRDAGLFMGFPQDTTWRRVKVEPSDFQRLKCISKDERWSRLTRGTRLIREAARNLDDYPELADRVGFAIRRIEQHLPIAELILVEINSGDLVLVEGHTRAVAYAILHDRAFQSFIGMSSAMGQWTFI
jgi:hypothetical protein